VRARGSVTSSGAGAAVTDLHAASLAGSAGGIRPGLHGTTVDGLGERRRQLVCVDR
jgi:hypothetical protein